MAIRDHVDGFRAFHDVEQGVTTGLTQGRSTAGAENVADSWRFGFGAAATVVVTFGSAVEKNAKLTVAAFAHGSKELKNEKSRVTIQNWIMKLNPQYGVEHSQNRIKTLTS